MSKKKTTTTPTPHDAAFRSFLANPDVARDFLELHLPAEYRQLCDLSTLKLEPATFVEPDLHQYASDILWSVKTTGGEDGYVYTLIEHQSTENLYMPFRMLRYSVAAMQSKRLVRTVLIFTESSDQLSRATDRVPGLPASPGYVQ